MSKRSYSKQNYIQFESNGAFWKLCVYSDIYLILREEENCVIEFSFG
jgi:hypothetical protein